MFPMLVCDATPTTSLIIPAAPKMGTRLIFNSDITISKRMVETGVLNCPVNYHFPLFSSTISEVIFFYKIYQNKY